jgi:hypothetical protein
MFICPYNLAVKRKFACCAECPSWRGRPCGSRQLPVAALAALMYFSGVVDPDRRRLLHQSHEANCRTRTSSVG